jgi:hypothetical protein
MDIDESLREVWQRQQPSQSLSHQLFDSVKRHRRAVIVQRAVEVLLTLAAVAVLGWPIWTGNLAPVHWLLIPFFTVFLVVSWTLVLRQRRSANLAVSENVAAFAKQRQLQLQDSMKDLKFTQLSAIALLVYAAVAFLGAHWLGDADWQFSANVLLVYSTCCYFLTRVLVRRKRRRVWREYRAVRRIG